MSVESVLYDRLKDAAGDLFPLVALKIYPVRAPQNAVAPFVTWQIIAETRHSAMVSDTQIVEARIQIDGWADTVDAARALGEAIRERMQRWRNATGTVVQGTFFLSRNDEYDEASEMYRSLSEVNVIYEE